MVGHMLEIKSSVFVGCQLKCRGFQEVFNVSAIVYNLVMMGNILISILSSMSTTEYAYNAQQLSMSALEHKSIIV